MCFYFFFQSTKRRKRQSKVVSSDVQEDVSTGKSFLKISWREVTRLFKLNGCNNKKKRPLIVSEGLAETEHNEKEEAATTDQSTEVKQVQANQEEQGNLNRFKWCLVNELHNNHEMSCLDSQVDLVIEVKGKTSNVTVSWDDKKEEGGADDVEMRTTAHDQMMDIGKRIHKDPVLLFCHIFFFLEKDFLDSIYLKCLFYTFI